MTWLDDIWIFLTVTIPEGITSLFTGQTDIFDETSLAKEAARTGRDHALAGKELVSDDILLTTLNNAGIEILKKDFIAAKAREELISLNTADLPDKTAVIKALGEENAKALGIAQKDITKALGEAKQAVSKGTDAETAALDGQAITKEEMETIRKKLKEEADATRQAIIDKPIPSVEDFKIHTQALADELPDEVGELTAAGFKDASEVLAGGFASAGALTEEAKAIAYGEQIRTLKPLLTQQILGLPVEAPPAQKSILDNIRDLMDAPAGFFRNAILDNITRNADGTAAGAEKAADSYIATVMGFNTSVVIANALAQIPTLGRFKAVGKLIDAANWSLGLGWLSWIVMGTPLQHAIARPMEKKYRRLYANTDLSRSQLEDLYLRKEISEAAFLDELHNLGFDEVKRSQIKGLVRKIPSQSEIMKWYSLGFMTKANATELLEWQGFREEHIGALFMEKNLVDVQAPKELARSQAEQAFREGIRSELWLREQLSRLGYADAVVEVLIELQKAKLEIDAKILTKSQLATAFRSGVMDRVQFKQALLNHGYTEINAETIIQVEELKIKPKEVTLTRSDYSRAFRQGVITESRFSEVLGEMGYTDQDIDLIITNEYLQTAIIPKRPSKSNYDQGFRQGIISESDYETALLELGYEPEDIDFLIILEKARIKVKIKELTKAELVSAWKFEVIDINYLIERLYEMGYDANDIDILLSIEVAKAGGT